MQVKRAIMFKVRGFEDFDVHGIQITGNTAFWCAAVAPKQTVKHDIGKDSWNNLSKCKKLFGFFFFPSA